MSIKYIYQIFVRLFFRRNRIYFTGITFSQKTAIDRAAGIRRDPFPWALAFNSFHAVCRRAVMDAGKLLKIKVLSMGPLAPGTGVTLGMTLF
jgi:hypothetical protein